MFNLRKFKSPPAVNAPGYFWFLNGKLEDDELRRQLRSMYAVDARTVCLHPLPKEFRDYFMSELEPEYLTEEYFKKYSVIADECAKLGMNCYLYDEGGWPSGSACGRVLASDPDRFAQRYLTLDGEDKYKIAVRSVTPGKAGVPNTLMREVTEKFLELTHEAYSAHIGKHLGKTFKFAFMDEPATPPNQSHCLPWTWDLFDEFKKRKGYDVEPLVVSMLKFESSPEAVKARSDYLDVVSQLFTERFVIPVREWCRKHNMLSGGHLSREDEWDTFIFSDFGGNALRVLRQMDFPGVDVIWRQLWPGSRLHPFPKLASSAANQNGSRFVSGEMFGVYGNGLTTAQMKFLIDYMMVCGVNTIITCVHPYSTRNGCIEGERPHFGKCNPQWPHLKPYHDYVARLSLLSTNSRPVVENALFFDHLSLWKSLTKGNSAGEQEKIACRLLESGCDFDYVDDDVLSTAVVRGGCLCIGKAKYKRLILPQICEMTPETEANLKKLQAKGLEILRSDDSNLIPPMLKTDAPDWRLRIRKMDLGGGDFAYLVLNTSTCAFSRRFEAREKGPAARCDIETGELVRIPHRKGSWKCFFAPLSSAVFLVGPSAAKAIPAPLEPRGAALPLKGGWEIRKVRQIKVGKNDFVVSDAAGPWRKTALGDWAGSLGQAFSGEAVYRIRFTVNDPETVTHLDLGEVKYIAEVTLNGKTLGKRLWPPYIFNIVGKLGNDVNLLEIKVVNTLANAMAPREVLKKWQSQLPFTISYEERQRAFEKESLESGLMGPVSLIAKKQSSLK